MMHKSLMLALMLGPVIGLAMPAVALSDASTSSEPAEAVEPDEVAQASEPVAVSEGQALAYLGVLAEATLPETAAQLALPEGVGLTLRQVAPQSPAEQAGFQRFDVLHKLDDQLLVNPQQFRTLIRAKRPGDEVTLTLFRAGQARDVKVTLGGQIVAAMEEKQPRRFEVRMGPEGVRLVPLDVEAVQQHREQIEQRREELQRRIAMLDEQLADNPDIDEMQRQKLQAMIDELRVDAAAPLDAGRLGVMRLNHGAPMTHFIRMADAEHMIEVRKQGDNQWLKATDHQGNVLFDGLIDTPEQRAQVPAEIATKLEKLQQRVRSEVQIQRHDAEDEAPAPAEQQAPGNPGNPGDQHMFH